MDIKVNRKTFEYLKQTRKRQNILYGSAGSGKSWSIAQFLTLEKLYKGKNNRTLITRKTRPALKKSCWLLINDLIHKYELPGCIPNKSDLSLFVGSNQMFFVPLDDPEKLKSFERINYIWGEEATEFNLDDYLQLNLRCRGENTGGINQLFFSFNPIDEQSFWKEIVDSPKDSVGVNHSTYKDNAFLEDNYIKVLEGLIDQDETYHKIYALGIWATPKNIIYSNWDIVDAFPECEEVGYGIDFGFNNPTGLLKIGLNDREAYLQELLYETKLTNTSLITELKKLIPEESRSDEMWADSAEPQRIEEIYGAGFNIHPCTKGKDSVKIGIDRCKRMRLHIVKGSENLLKEIKSYKWKEDKNGHVMDEPVKFRNHLMDAMRYYLGEKVFEGEIGYDFVSSDTPGGDRESAHADW